ncbi:hypothetical protein TNCV_3030371 [Trichonephila clavipes]|nr:hypothetical protein TNCV_3030371 [Trichonephila clavipes]
MKPKWSPNWPPKMMPTWLYRQDFAKFSLNRHYNTSDGINGNYSDTTRLTNAGKRSEQTLRHIPMTPHHRLCRMDFCKPLASESRVIFSDESRFSPNADEQRNACQVTGLIQHLLSRVIRRLHVV